MASFVSGLADKASKTLESAKTAVLGPSSKVAQAHSKAQAATVADGEQKAAEAAKLYTEAADAIEAALRNGEFPPAEAPQAAQMAQMYRQRSAELSAYLNQMANAAGAKPVYVQPQGHSSADAAKAAAGAAAIGAFAGLAFPVVGGLTVAAMGAAAGVTMATRNDTAGSIARSMGSAAASGVEMAGRAIGGGPQRR